MIGKAFKALLIGALLVYLYNHAPTIIGYIILGGVVMYLYNKLNN